MTDITFEVTGDPKAQPRQRHRVVRRGHKAFAQNYTPSDDPVNSWKDLIVLEARKVIPDTPLSGPLKVTAEYRFRRPKSHFRTGKRAGELKPDAPLFHTKKPDRDNLDKSFMDIMTQIGFWDDDCHVVDGRITKLYAAPGQRPGAVFSIEPLEESYEDQ